VPAVEPAAVSKLLGNSHCLNTVLQLQIS